MLSKRDYLASLNPPLAISGARGRFSKAAQAHIARVEADGMKFSDGGGLPRPDLSAGRSLPSTDLDGFPTTEHLPVVYPKLDNDPVIRDLKTIQGYTDTGTLVESGVCFKCTRHVSRCNCSAGIFPSPIVVRWARKIDAEYGMPLDKILAVV